MKNILTLFLIFISGLSFSQSLENTEWEVYFEGDYQLNFLFSADTFYLSQSSQLTPFSIYTEISDTFNIKDLEDSDGCFDKIGNNWGSYLFKIENDTLSFEVISDECDSRVESLSITGVFVKAVDTSIDDLDFFEEVVLFPNPISNGMLNIQSKEKLDHINIYNAFGQLLKSSTNATAFDLSKYNSHLFLVEIIKGNRSTVKRIVKL